MTTAPAAARSRPARLRVNSPPPTFRTGSVDSSDARFTRIAMLETMIEVQRIRNRKRLAAGLLLIGIGAAAVVFALVW